MQVEPLANGLRLTAFDESPPFYLLSEEFAAEPLHPPVWIDGFFLGVEAYRGQKDLESYLHAADFEAIVHPGQSVTLVASTDPAAVLSGSSAQAERRLHEQGLLERAHAYWRGQTGPKQCGKR